MSGAAWLQLVALLVLLAISTPLLGSYMAKVYGDEQGPGRPRLRADRAAHLPRLRRRREDRAALDHVRALAARVQLRVSVVVLYAQLRLAGSPAVQPRPPEGRRSAACRSTPR